MISFLIPFRDADGTRTKAMTWIVARWRSHYPDAEFILAADDGKEPFNKSMAVNKAFAKSTGEIIVILDADTWVENKFFATAVQMVRDGAAPWVIPASTSWRLTREASERIMSSDPDMGMRYARGDVEQVSGVVGFCHVLPRAAFECVGGMDERFRGWGGEDGAFKMSLDTLWGTHATLRSTLVSLWHDRPRDYMGRRIWTGQTQRLENNRLWRRYIQAMGFDNLMLRVLAERKGPRWYSSVSRRRGLMDRATFRSSKYPALMLRTGADKKKFKFSGGRLVVGGADIELVKTFVNSHPEYGITLVREEPAPTPDGALDALSDEDEAGSDERRPLDLSAMTVTDLKAALKGLGKSTSGDKAALQERLQEAVG
jgi:glycosyltransferase involved in cell wall biosynthesis